MKIINKRLKLFIRQKIKLLMRIKILNLILYSLIIIFPQDWEETYKNKVLFLKMPNNKTKLKKQFKKIAKF